MGVEHKLHRLRQEHVRVRRLQDPVLPLPPEVREYNHQAEVEMNAAQRFFESSGMKLSLFEFNQDMLENRGRIMTSSGFHYNDEGEEPQVVYSSNLGLRWQSRTGAYFILVVSIEGDLLNTFETETGQQDYVRNLSMSLFSSEDANNTGDQVGPTVQYLRRFDFYEIPTSFESWDTEEEADRYTEVEEKEGTEDLGGNPYQDWVEANIAGFIRFHKRTKGHSPL